MKIHLLWFNFKHPRKIKFQIKSFKQTVYCTRNRFISLDNIQVSRTKSTFSGVFVLHMQQTGKCYCDFRGVAT